MQALYDLSVKLTLDTTGMAAGASVAMKLFAALQKTAGITGAQIDSLGKSLKVVLAGAAVTGVGFGLFSFVDKAAKRAGDLETILVGIQNRTRGTIPGGQLVNPQTGQLTTPGAAFTNTLTNIGLGNQMNNIDVGGVAQAANRAGITDFTQLQNMLKPLANYSEVMFSSTKADPTQSAKIATEFAHLYSAFGDKKIGGVSDTQYLVDQLGKAMQIVPVSQNQFLRLMSQFVGTERPLYKNKGSKALITDTIDEGVLMAQMGQGSRGGNQIARIITSMMGGARGKTAQAAIAGIQHGTHIPFADSKGNIDDPSLLLKALATTAQKLNPAQTMTIFTQAFQQNGARLAGLFSDPTVGSRLKAITDAMKSMPDTAAQQRAYNQSMPGQQVQAQKNWDSAYTNFGLVALPAITRFATAMANATAGLVRFTQQHPALLKFIATLTLVTAGVMLVVGPILMLVGLIGAASVGFEVLGGVVAAIATIGFAPFLVIILAVGAALVGITLIIMNFGKIMHEVGAGLHNLAVMFGLIKAPAVATIPKGGAPPASQVQAIQLRHNHYELARKNEWYYQDSRTNKWIPDGRYTPGKGTGGGGSVWDMPPIQGRRSGSGTTVLELHVHPGAVGPITVHGAAGHDEEALAARVGAHVVRGMGDELVHALTSGAPSILGLSPVLNVPVQR
jgi:hypothetical protein